ncbi:MAG: hypothetical protein KDI92_11590 [Xanthomonadales bacterium]|nr:hypothetical protein [Xanthomonadales bacterium]
MNIKTGFTYFIVIFYYVGFSFAQSWDVTPLTSHMNFEPELRIDDVVRWDDGSGYNWVVNGRFNDSLGRSYIPIGRWNGKSWIGVGQYANTDEIYIDQIEVDPNGDLVVAGFFSQINKNELNHIARWNGSEWLAYGNGFNDSVSTLFINKQGEVFVAGEFTQAINSSTTLNHLAYWDGKKWNPMGSGLQQGDEIYAMIGDGNGGIYVTGNFKEIGGTPIERSAHWDGNSWKSIDPTDNPRIYEMVLDQNKNLVFIEADGLVKMWNGTTQATLSNGMIGEPYSLAFNETEQRIVLLALSDDATFNCHIQYWDNIQWQTTNNFNCGQETSLHIAENGKQAISGHMIGKNELPGLHFKTQNNFGQFKSLGNGLSGAYASSHLGKINTIHQMESGEIWVGGEFDLLGDTVMNNIGYWDGRQWHTPDTGLTDQVQKVTSGSGQLFAAAGLYTHTQIYQLNGNEWLQIADDINGVVKDMIVLSSGELLVAGNFDQINGESANRMAIWDGTQWQSFGTWPNSGSVNALLETEQGILYAAGYEKLNDLSLRRVMKLQQSSWNLMGEIQPGEVNAIALDENNLPIIAGKSNAHVMYWNNYDWQPMGTNPQATIGYRGVNDMIVTQTGEIFLVGDQYLVNYNQSLDSWERVVTTNDYIYDLIETFDGQLIFTGEFTKTNNWNARYLLNYGPGITTTLEIETIENISNSINLAHEPFEVTIILSATQLPENGVITVSSEAGSSCSTSRWNLNQVGQTIARCTLMLNTDHSHQITAVFSGSRNLNHVWFKTHSTTVSMVSDLDLIYRDGFES